MNKHRRRGSKRRGAARGHRGGMGAKQSTPGRDSPPSHAQNKGDSTAGGRQAWEGDQPRLFWWFCGCCFPAISAGQRSWKAPAPGSPAVREGQMAGGRREPEHSLPLPGLEKHAQPWLRMWEQQSLQSLGLGMKEKVFLCARSYHSRDGFVPMTPHPINPETEPQAFLGQAQKDCAVIPRSPLGLNALAAD